MPGRPINHEIISESTPEVCITEIPQSRQRFRLRWIPSSKEEFEVSIKKLLSYLHPLDYEVENVEAGQVFENNGGCCKSPKLIKVQLPTLFVNRSRGGIPLVFFHGMGMGFGFFVSVIKAVAYPGPMISVDLPGFGNSTQFKFPKNAKDAEAVHIKVLEAWRASLGLEKIIIAGMSFGGYLGASYALSYPERVAHLVLIDAWGVPEKPKQVTSLVDEKNPIMIRLMALASSQVGIFTPFRLLGPWGPDAFCNAGNPSGFEERFEEQMGAIGSHHAMNEYVYHCVAQSPTYGGEESFRIMSKWIVYAREPLCRRLHQLAVPTTMIVGGKSWVPWIPKEELERLVGPGCRLDFQVIPSATHENITTCKELEDILQNLIVREGWADK